ncbi:MAG: hypothetical protein AAFQ41_06150 [Cyanobacteria bacterium J06623_7]
MSGKLISAKSNNWRLEPDKPIWTIISAYALLILGLLLVLPRLLIPVFPASSLAIGIYFYRRYPLHYVGFTWWIWFLGPFIKRLIDYRVGGPTPWPYHFTPLLVTSIALATLWRYLPRTYKRDGLPFALCCLAIFYGFFIGLIRQPTVDYDREILILLNWLAPVSFGFHLFINWRQYPRYRQLFQQVFLWAIIVMGCYGIIQFLLAPPWDKQFLIQLNGDSRSSYMGVPQALGMRVWSTMGNSMTFSFNLLPGLILLFISRHRWRLMAGLLGYFVFLLARVKD